MTTVNKLIEETRACNPDKLGNKLNSINIKSGKVACYINFHGSRSNGNSWERVDFFLTTASSHGKIKIEELEKLLSE